MSVALNKPKLDNPPPSVNETIQADNKEPSLEREMIDLLKEQVKIKDGQLQNQGEQLKGLNELNVSLNKAMVRQSEKIETLLQLTGGKIEVITDEAEPADPTRDRGEPDRMAA